MSRDSADAATVGFRSSLDVLEYQTMNLYGGLTGRLAAHMSPQPGSHIVTRSCAPATLYDGLRDVLGAERAARVKVSVALHEDCAVYTLDGRAEPVTGLGAFQARGEYDLGRRIAEALQAAAPALPDPSDRPCAKCRKPDLCDRRGQCMDAAAHAPFERVLP